MVARQPRPSVGEENGNTSSSSSSSPERAAYEDDTDFYAVKNDSQSSIGATSIRSMSPSPSSTSERQYRQSPISRIPPEILLVIFGKLGSPSDLRNCVLVSRTWARNCVELLWHRPSCNSWDNLLIITKTIRESNPFFPYTSLIRRLNLSNLAENVSDGSVAAFENCKRVERLTLTGCQRLTDSGVMSLVHDSKSLLALDVTGLAALTDLTLFAVAESCRRLQGLNITDCEQITDDSLTKVAETCRSLKRVCLSSSASRTKY